MLLKKTGQGRCRLQIRTDSDAQAVLDEIGFPPLPPYIKRDDDPAVAAEDERRYQTVYADTVGSAAAPTAGLHFTPAVLDAVAARGVRLAHVDLEIGLDTFRPISTDTLEAHQNGTRHLHQPQENSSITDIGINPMARARAKARPSISDNSCTL